VILHKLILHHLHHKDDPDFYDMQARDAIAWTERAGVVYDSKTTVLDLGCGHGIFGANLAKRGCIVTLADESNLLLPELASARFLQINLDREDAGKLGAYDVVILSNVFEHLSKPEQFLDNAHKVLTPKGRLFLSWTNWLSPWGGHEFSPWHFLGPTRGHLIYDKVTGNKRLHTPFVNLFPTYIGRTLRQIKASPHLRLVRMAPRYYPEFAFIMHLPWVREFLAWNCALLLERKREEG
jgi:SAM-dependent methyltransferase